MTDHLEIGDAGSRVALGGADWSVGPSRDDDRAVRTIWAALDAGVTIIDTARAYTTVDHASHNETLIARALSGRNDRDVLVATKGGHFRIDADRWGVDGSPEAIRADCEASLHALGVDRIDLFFLHMPDPQVPFGESVSALVELQAAGKIARIGLSNITRSQLTEARNLAAISAVENHFSPLFTDHRELVDTCSADRIAFFAYSPFKGQAGSAPLRQALPGASAIADSLGISVHRLVVAWHLRQSATLVAVVGASRPESIVDSAAASDVELSAAEWAAVEQEFSNVALSRHARER